MSAGTHRILVIDDDPAIHDDFRKALTPGSAGPAAPAVLERARSDGRNAAVARPSFEVDSAYQGQEGLACVQAALQDGRPYALAFVDVRMPPGWDGIETIARLWQADGDLQVAICTAYSDYSWEAMTARLGHNDRLLILRKPVDADEIRQLAACMTTKREFGLQVKRRLEELLDKVQDRTLSLEEANARLRREIEEHAQARSGREEISRRLEMILDAAEEGVLGLDLEQRVTFINAAGARLCGLAVSEMIGKAFSELVEAEPEEAAAYAEARARGTRYFASAETYRRRDGSVVVIERVSNAIREDGHMVGSVTVFRDVGERRRAEAELRRSQELADAAAREKRLAELQARFVAMVSHEFRTPLATILAAASAVVRYEDRMTPAQRAERLGTIQREVAQMTELLEDVLTIGRADAGKLVCVPERVRIEDLCREIVARTEKTVARAGRIVLESAGVSPEAVVDPKLLHQILGNLVTNAVKYSPDDTVVRLRVRRDGGALIFCVEDQGIGIPPEDQVHLFEPFHRAGNVGKVPGSGLGLAITRKAVQLHGGTIRLESVPGKGTTFEVTLPQTDA